MHTLSLHDALPICKKSELSFKTPDFHRELWAVTLQGHDVLIVVPRGFAKTTAVSKILVSWLLLFGLEKSILIISSRGLGEAIIGDIRRELENNAEIKVIFGEMVPTESRKDNKTEKWQQRELQLLNGTEVKTLTKGQAVRGQRPTLILIDDPEENKDIKNPIIAEEFFNWVFTSLYNTLDDGGCMIVLGTIIGQNCFVNRLKAEADSRNFKVFQYPAIIGFNQTVWEKEGNFEKAVEGAKSLWPEKWGLDKLIDKFHKIKEKPFFQEFMNVPFKLNGSPVFGITQNLVVIEPIRIEGNWQIFQDTPQPIYLGIDVANGAESGDYSVIVARNIKFELVAVYRGHISQTNLTKETDWIVSKHTECFIVPENNIALAYLNAAQSFDWFSQIYRQKKFDKVVLQETEIVGFNTNAKTKILLIDNYREKVEEGLQVAQIIKDEVESYYHDERGGMNAIAPNHDDAVIADGLCCLGISQGMPAPMFTTF
jgi:hypothetical protein